MELPGEISPVFFDAMGIINFPSGNTKHKILYLFSADNLLIDINKTGFRNKKIDSTYQMKAWFDTKALHILPKSTMGKAIGYMLGRWKYLRGYDEEYFGSCSNHAECEAVCPKEISISAIARMRREYWKALAG